MIKIGLKEWVIEKLDNKKYLYEMSNIYPKETKLKTNLHLLPDGYTGKYGHWIHVKVDLKDEPKKDKNKSNKNWKKDGFPIKFNKNNDIEPLNKNGQYNKLDQTNKKLVDSAMKFVEQNKDIIIAYWYNKFDEDDLHDILQGKISLEAAIKKYNR